MGEFIDVSAFRTEDIGAVLATARKFFEAHDLAAQSVPASNAVGNDDVLLYPPANGWTTILWPQYFTEHAVVEFVSRELGVLASTAQIYDGDYWTHSLLRDGVILDRFATLPDYFTSDPAEVERLAATYKGDPDVIAQAVGCAAEQVSPYLVHVDLDESESGKAFEDDEFELSNPWVFVDFWRRIGPLYPEDVSAYSARLRLGTDWQTKLPAGGAEF